VTLYSYRGIFGRISNHHYLNHPGKLSSIHLIKHGAAGRISNHHYLNHPGKLLSIHLIKHGAAKGKYLLRRKPPSNMAQPKESIC